MRFSLILVALLASADALAQGAPEIVTPTQNGVAEGVSTYTSADGTRVEITWHDGRKHGPFRKVTHDGIVLETGNYVLGQRAGEWVQFDEAGEKISSGQYLFGVPHGKHERFGVIDNKRQIVAYTTYVLGLKHGPALVNKKIVGGLALGAYAWDKPHGIFRSKNTETRFFCGASAPDGMGRRRMDEVCSIPAELRLYVPIARHGSSTKGVLTAPQRASLCDGQAALKIPVIVNDTTLDCPGHRRFIHAESAYARFVRDLFSAEDVIRDVQENFLDGGFQSAYFTQTKRRAGKQASARKLTGRLDFYIEGLVEWLYDSKTQCDFSVRRETEQVVGFNPRSRRRAVKPIADFVLGPMSALAFSNDDIFKTYKAVFTDRESRALVIDLVSRAPDSEIERVRAQVEVHGSRRRLALKSLEIRMRNGETVLTELHEMGHLTRHKSVAPRAYAELPEGWKDFKATPADKLGCKGQRW